MFKWLLPHDADFFIYFERHIQLTIESAKILYQFISEGDNAIDCAQKIKKLEHEADGVTHRCVEELHKTFITPFQREDIHRLISHMDDILDTIEDIAKCFVLYKLKEITPEAVELARLLVRCVSELEKALQGLRRLTDLSEAQKHFIEINRIENEADTIHFKAMAKLFDTCEDAHLLIKWKEIYGYLEQAIDDCEEVAHIVEGVILESS